MAAATPNYVVSTAEFNNMTKELREDVRGMLSFTAKVYKSRAGYIVPTANGNQVFQRRHVRAMWKPILDEIRSLRYFFNAAKRKKRGKKAFSINAFTQPLTVTDNAWNFFTTANLGLTNPVMVSGYSLDGNGMLVPSALQEPTSIPVSQFLKNHPLFGQKIARRAILGILFYIYARENLLSGNATGGGVGSNISNRGKPFIQWNTKYYGATGELYDAFRASFDRVKARAGQVKLNSKGQPELKKDGVTPKTYAVMDENFFDASFFSIAASDSVNSIKAGQPGYIAVPDAATLKAYGDLVSADETAIKAAMKAARDAGGVPMAGYRPPRFNQIAAQVAPGNQALALYAQLDELQRVLSYINRLHGQNFAAVDAQRQKYREGLKKPQAQQGLVLPQ